MVESLDLTFDKGLSVITGETGAGKSVMISALGLILGQRADTKAIKEGCDRCVLEAEFTDIDSLRPFFEAHDLEYDEPSCIIRRELSINGKSRAFVNDSPISLGLLKDLGAELLDIHSQHENLWLGKDSFQLEVLDTIAQSEDLLQQYRLSYYAYEKSRKDLIDLEKRLQEQAKEQDYMQFQYQQL
ncbi:MAG: AAA family ATPase, partial [Bacteroidales bacterium]|nr:AAA family ATPase [Bacteroidales bacterium]